MTNSSAHRPVDFVKFVKSGTYAATLRRLNERIGRGWRLGLEGMRSALENLPPVTFPVVLVGGTNGKGSVAAHLHRSFSDEGLRVGLTTSPHLHDVRERIVVGDASIPEQEFDRLFEEVVFADDGTATYFETLALMAILCFSKRAVDLAVVEIGMGGRLDAFNVLDPIVSVVTSVGLEHTQWLGETIEAIALEKAQIARPGRPVVLGTDLPSLVAEVRRIGARPVFAQATVPGDYRDMNRATARVAAREIATALGLSFDETRFEVATARTRWPGRFEVVSGSPEIIFDAAHNPPAARALAAVLRTHRRNRRVVAVVAFLQDKDAAAFFAALGELVDEWIVTEVISERALAAVSVPRPANSRIVADPGAAFDAARIAAGPDGIVLVTGSIYLLGALR